MSEKSFPDYGDLNCALSKTSLKLHPSQVHGLVSGLLCGNPDHSSAWEELVTGSEPGKSVHDVLQSLYDGTAKQLDELLFDFQLVLPDDAVELPMRAEALTLWCQGFLTGLKLAQIQIVNREPGEITEAINDIIEIAKMNFEEVVSSEEDESAYSDLMEYVRMAAILIYQDLRKAETSRKSASQSSHLH